MDIKAFWNDVITQNRFTLPSYFCEDAVICWHCTNEKFTVDEYIRANCDYPGKWHGEVERIEQFDSKHCNLRFYVISRHQACPVRSRSSFE